MPGNEGFVKGQMTMRRRGIPYPPPPLEISIFPGFSNSACVFKYDEDVLTGEVPGDEHGGEDGSLQLPPRVELLQAVHSLLSGIEKFS